MNKLEVRVDGRLIDFFYYMSNAEYEIYFEEARSLVHAIQNLGTKGKITISRVKTEIIYELDEKST